MNKEAELKDFLLQLHEKVPGLTDRELFDYVLENVVRLSGSVIGFFHLVSDDQKSIHLVTWNTEASKNCVAPRTAHYPVDQAGNWVDCIRLKRPVIYNDYAVSPNRKGLPEGHIPLRRFMSVPVVEGDKVKIIFGVGNKAEDYSEQDAALVQVVAHALQRIVAQRRAEQALSRSEAYFRSLIENASDTIVILDGDGRVSSSSPSNQKVFGYSPGELNGRNIFDFIHEDDLPAVRETFNKVLESPRAIVHQELRFLHKSGSWRILDATARNLLEDEAVRGIVVNSHDVTLQKMSENDLVMERNHLRALIEFYRRPDISVYDITSFVVERCIKISKSQIGFFGFVDNLVTSMTTYLWSEQAAESCAVDFRPVKFSIEHAGIWADPIRTRAPLVINDYQRPDPRKRGYPEGHVPVRRLVSIPVLKDGRAVAILAVANKEQDYTEADLLHLSLFLESSWDMISRKGTENKLKEHTLRVKKINERLRQQIHLRKRAEEERRQSEYRLLQAQKAESLGRMAGAIAHHFNNLLGVVMGNLEMAGMDLPRGSSAEVKISEAMKASRQAVDISSLMLAYLGQRLMKSAPVEISEICREALPLLALSLPKGVNLRTDLPVPSPIILADAIQVRQVLNNLVVNAGEAMGEGNGEVTVAISETPVSGIQTSRFYPPEWEPGASDYVRISVSDTGPGMDTETLNKVFDPFFSTKFTGRGLGLPVVMGIVKAHGGMVAVESLPGRGSVFQVFLPLLKKESPTSTPTEPVHPAPSPGRGVVLLADDEPMFCKMARTMIEHLGYEVVTAFDGVDALEMFRRHRDHIRCVVLDISMPRMDGWETLGALRALKPGLPVILASGFDEAKAMQGDHSELPQAFLSKPFRLKELEAALCSATKEPT